MTVEENLQKITELLIEIHEKPDIWEIIATFCAFLGVLVAVWSLTKTIKAQNKQSLFQKRLDVYIPCKKFLNLISERSKILRDASTRLSRNFPTGVYPEFEAITSIDFFEGSQNTRECLEDERRKYAFLRKLAEIDFLAEKSTLLFEGKDARILKEFISNFHDVVAKMYEYTIINKNIEKDIYNLKEVCPSISQKQKYDYYGEPKSRKELGEYIDNLLKSKDALIKNGTLNKLRKQMVLWKESKCFLTKTH